MRRRQGYTLRVSTTQANHPQIPARCQPSDGSQDTPTAPAQRKTRREDKLHDAEPLVRSRIKIAYGPVPSGGQELDQHIHTLTTAGHRKIFTDKNSGKTALRPQPKACHTFRDTGNTLVVPSLDHYDRNLQDPINMIAELPERGIGFTSPHENPDTTNPGARLDFHVLAALAALIHELTMHGTREGPAAARPRGDLRKHHAPPAQHHGTPTPAC
ncbi:hypothetical protein RKD29_000026 [Streptomyces tendae]|uniref:recombinase family protein n=1 Tax=Streptomyces tendae TaxID=1932 RepID=UPI0038366C80